MISRAFRTKITSTRPCAFFSSRSTCLCCGMSSFLCQTAQTPFKSTFQTRDFTQQRNEENHISHLIENNKRWVEEMKLTDPDYFDKLSRPQKPKYLYFGCSDSRVPSNAILGLRAGELFVHRNVGNIIAGNDMNALSVLEYAVGHLNVTDIIVTGHYDCGAVRAASTKQDLGLLENWTRLIRDVYRLHRDFLDSIEDDEERINKLVELNVTEQCINLFKTGIVQRKRIQGIEQGREVTPRIHGLVFDPCSGLLKPLKIDFARKVGSLEYIYGLYARDKSTRRRAERDDGGVKGRTDEWQ